MREGGVGGWGGGDGERSEGEKKGSKKELGLGGGVEDLRIRVYSVGCRV